jgi:type II secretory pathway pseudopilin PulG
MIELLTVIAIIAILAAVIFPIFSTVLENGRASTSMSSLHDISTKLAQYELDNHRAPDVLFGYVYCQDKNTGRNSHVMIDTNTVPVPMDQALGQAESNFAASGNAADDPKNWFSGLYPTYIKDINEFKDPNNQASYSATADPAVNVLCPSTDDACPAPVPNQTVFPLVKANHTDTGVTPKFPHGYYVADAFDVNPKVIGPGQIADESGNEIYVPRYQYAWTAVDNSLMCPPQKSSTAPPTTQENEGRCTYRSADPTNPSSTLMILVDDKYLHQLHWQAPPERSYVTCSTYHVKQSGLVLVLNNGGNVRKVGYNEFAQYGGDVDTIVPIGPDLEISQARFWLVNP